MRQPRRRLVQHVRLAQFDGVLDRTQHTVISVGSGLPVRFRDGLATRLKHTFGAELQLLTVDRREIPDTLWFHARFRTSMGPVGAVREGYYLFDWDRVIGFHPHLTHLLDDAAATEQLVAYLRERIELAKVDVAPFIDERPPPYQGPPPRDRPTARPRIDAYAVLEVSRAASDADLRDAYRRAMRLNHPDKVAHLSRAIQDFALQQTVRIQHAWELVRADKGW
ncbi:MAG: hypothetical protein ACI8PZ_004050 [Myxococcota bacterium]|jgi:hypothetical protein